jgi:hypothetical protein
MADVSPSYFVRINGKQLGPHSAQQLREMAARGMLGLEDEVQRVGGTRWHRVDTVKWLLPLLPSPMPSQDRPEPPPAPSQYVRQDSVQVPEETSVEMEKARIPSQYQAPPMPAGGTDLCSCPDCGQQVSQRASVCPHCGAPGYSALASLEKTMPTEERYQFLAAWVGVVKVLGILAAFLCFFGFCALMSPEHAEYKAYAGYLLVCALVIPVVCWWWGDMIRLFLDIEKNTRPPGRRP